MYKESQKIVKAAHAGLSALQNKNDEPSGKLRVTLLASMFVKSPFSDYLAEFTKLYPKIEMQYYFSDQQVDLVGSKFDVAIRWGLLEDSQYKARKIFESDHSVIASPDYMKGRAPIEHMLDLELLDWFQLMQISLNQQLSYARDENIKVNPHIVMELDNVAIMVEMVVKGLGVCAVPTSLVVDELKRGLLVDLSGSNWSLNPVSCYAVWPQNVASDSVAHRFINFLAEKFKRG